MIDTKEYVETVLFAAVKAMYPSVERLVYEKYGHPMFREHDSVHIDLAPPDEYSCGKSITLDVTGMDVEGIRRTVTDSLYKHIPKRPVGQAIDWRI